MLLAIGTIIIGAFVIILGISAIQTFIRELSVRKLLKEREWIKLEIERIEAKNDKLDKAIAQMEFANLKLDEAIAQFEEKRITNTL